MADNDNTTGGAGGTAGGTSKNELMKTSKTAGHSYVTADQDREATDGDTLYYPQELFTDSQPNGIQFFINARRFGKDNTVEDMNGDSGNGFKINRLTPAELSSGINRALKLYTSKGHLNDARQRAMKLNYSWTVPSQSYQQLYHSHN